jgi:HAD superfamily hydrolase (TIGR01509 family)
VGCLLALSGLVVVLSGCRAELVVDVAVAHDGSGRVTAVAALDPEASQQLVDLATGGLQLEDLAQAGWEIEPPTAGEDGWTRIVAAKDFGTPEQLAEVIDELDGGAGLFEAVELQRIRSFARVDYHLTGVLDPTGGFARFGDPELEAALGVGLDELALREGLAPEDVTVSLRVDLPGDLREAAVTGTTLPGDDTVGWTATLADPAPLAMDAASTSRLVGPLVLRGVAVVAAVLAALVLLGQALRLLRPESRRRHPAARPRAPARAAAPVAAAPAAPATGRPGPATVPKVVALDAMGVLYQEGDDVRRLLIPFARERGSLLPDDELEARARALSLGRMTAAEFWTGIGAVGDPHELDRSYLARHQLNAGVVRFLRALRERGIRAACITNDAASWALALRRRHSLEGLIDLWVVSGSVGIRKPDPPIFEALRRLAQVPAGDILLVDDERANLDAARALGFRTAWFSPDGTDEDAAGHPILRSLDVPADDRRPGEVEPSAPAR